MASPNLNMRDPVMYRILHAEHHRTGDKWCIYPMYDYAHGAIAIRSKASRTRSARWNSKTTGRCTTGIVEQLGIYHPQQIEFARLNLTYTVMSKRKLLKLVQDGHVRGWDDPRMPTISGMRRRGYTPEAIRNFCGSDRRVEVQRHHRDRAAGTLRARGSEQARAARDGRAAPAARW